MPLARAGLGRKVRVRVTRDTVTVSGSLRPAEYRRLLQQMRQQMPAGLQLDDQIDVASAAPAEAPAAAAAETDSRPSTTPGRAEVERRVLLAEGSVGRALAGAAGAAGETVDLAADRLLAAVRGGPKAWAAAALAQPPWAARGAFTLALDGVLVRLRNAAARDAGTNVARVQRWIGAIQAVERVRAEAQGNVNPQLALATLAHELERLA